MRISSANARRTDERRSGDAWLAHRCRDRTSPMPAAREQGVAPRACCCSHRSARRPVVGWGTAPDEGVFPSCRRGVWCREATRNAESPTYAGLSRVRRRGLEPPPGYPGPGPQPCNPAVRSVLCVQNVQIARVCGRNGRNGRSGCCRGCCHESGRLAVGAARHVGSIKSTSAAELPRASTRGGGRSRPARRRDWRLRTEVDRRHRLDAKRLAGALANPGRPTAPGRPSRAMRRRRSTGRREGQGEGG